MSQVVAYLYHDANTPQDAHPWLHSTMLVLAADRRPELRNETPLVTLAQAEAMVAAERERWITLAKRCVDAIDAYEACAYGPPPREEPMLQLRADLVAATAPGPAP